MRIAPETPQSDMVLHPNEIKKRVQQLLHGERTRNGRSCVRVSHMFHMIYSTLLGFFTLFSDRCIRVGCCRYQDNSQVSIIGQTS